MLRTSLAASLAVVCSTLFAPPAAAEPTAAKLVLDLALGCFGCGVYGPTGNSVSGVVASGEGAFMTGATLGGTITTTTPVGTTCMVTNSASGTLTTSYGYTAPFTWTGAGPSVAATVDGMPAAGTLTITSPAAGHPCGMPVLAKLTLSVAGNAPRFPRAKGHVTIHRFPGTAPILLFQPVAQNGVQWTCRDVHTNAIVVHGGALTAPDPGVRCFPPGGYNPECARLFVGGYFAAASSAGSIVTTARCGSASLGVTITNGAPNQQMALVNGALPLECLVDETLVNAATADYWTYCDVNAA